MVVAPSIAEHAATAQLEVQRQLGRCLIRLQQYERTVKEMVALHDIDFRSGAIETSLQSRRDMVANKTLGQVVASLFDSHIVPEGAEDSNDDEGDAPIGGIAIRLKIRLQLSRDDYKAAKRDIGDLVRLRNRLVHQFVEQHDLWSDAGCEAALADLQTAYERIDNCIAQLQQWADWLDQSRRGVADFLHSDEFHNAVVLGILPDGRIAWPIAAVAEYFRDAWTSLSSGGWAAVNEAGAWISARHPDMTPTRHGCASWRHVLHESGQFDVQYFQADDRRVAHYRPRAVTPAK